MAAISPVYFQMYFREWKGLYFDYNPTEVCSYMGRIDNTRN